MPSSSRLTLPLLLALALSLALLPGGAHASREMLVNQPLPGDTLKLSQPTYEWSRRGPARLRSLHRYARAQRGDIRKQNHHAPPPHQQKQQEEAGEGAERAKAKHGSMQEEEEQGIGGTGLSWDQVLNLPPEEPFPMGRSEDRILNFGQVSRQREQECRYLACLVR